MKLVCPYFVTPLEIKEGEPFSVTIENPSLFRHFLEDIHMQMEGVDGESVLSVDNVPVSFRKYADILENFAPFDINTKSLLSKVSAALERVAVDERHYLATSEVLAGAERYIMELCFDFPFRVECRKLNAGAFIKMASPSVAEDFAHPLEAVLTYMQIMLDFEKDKLFIAVNMRSYFDDEDMARFVQEIHRKQFCVLFIESSSHPLIPGVGHLTIDRDLCEF